MTLKELKNRFYGNEFAGYGHYLVKFEIRGKIRQVVTTNLGAIDRIRDNDLPDMGRYDGYTLRQAYHSLYRETADYGK